MDGRMSVSQDSHAHGESAVTVGEVKLESPSTCFETNFERLKPYGLPYRVSQHNSK